MAHHEDVLFGYVLQNFRKYGELFEHGHPERALNRLAADLQLQGVETTKLQLVTALVRLQRSGWLEKGLLGRKYLLPFTLRFVFVYLFRVRRLFSCPISGARVVMENWTGKHMSITVRRWKLMGCNRWLW